MPTIKVRMDVSVRKASREDKVILPNPLTHPAGTDRVLTVRPSCRCWDISQQIKEKSLLDGAYIPVRGRVADITKYISKKYINGKNSRGGNQGWRRMCWGKELGF